MDRRSFLRGTAAASAGAALAPSFPSLGATEEASLYEAAKQDGEVIWYTAHFDTQTAEGIGNAFARKYPGVTPKVTRVTAQVAFQRLDQELRVGSVECDVFSSTDVGHFVRLKPKGVFLKWTPPDAAKTLAQTQGLDADDEYFVSAAGLICITYNKNKVREGDLPRNWSDLADPRWKDQVSLGHPAFSGYVGTWVVEMRKLYGWDFFEKLKKNNPQIGQSINDTVTMLNSGERSVAAGPAALTLQTAARGNPLGVVYPTDGALLMISPSAIMSASKRPHAAKLLMNFLLGPEANQVVVDNFGYSIWPGIPPAPGAKPLDEVKTIRPTVDEIVKGIPEVIKQWRDTFGV